MSVLGNRTVRILLIVCVGLLAVGLLMPSFNPYQGAGDMRRFDWAMLCAAILFLGLVGSVIFAVVIIRRRRSGRGITL